MSNTKNYSSLTELSADIDAMDAQLGELMKGFDTMNGDIHFGVLMDKCNALVDQMEVLYKLEVSLKLEG